MAIGSNRRLSSRHIISGLAKIVSVCLHGSIVTQFWAASSATATRADAFGSQTIIRCRCGCLGSPAASSCSHGYRSTLHDAVVGKSIRIHAVIDGKAPADIECNQCSSLFGCGF